MHKPQKYESQLHIGLMAIIIVLLLLCSASNFVLYRQRGVERGRVERTLQDLCAMAAKQLDVQSGRIPPVEQIELTRSKMNLTTLTIMPHSMSLDSTAGALAADAPSRFVKWGRAGRMSLLVVSERVGEIQQGDSAEFSMLNQVATASGFILLVAGAQFPEYEMLIQASDTLFYASIAGLLVLGLLYKTVTRVITAPFERLKRNAERTGRFDKDGADIESIINDYEQLVAQLQKSERELKALSQLNQQKVDTLENFSRYLMKSLVSGVITLDGAGKILSLNQASSALLGLEDARWVGRKMSELPHYCDSITEMVRVASQSGKIEPYRELSIDSGASRMSPVGVTVSAVYDADDSCIGFSILLNDLGEVNRLRSELQNREQLAALGEMAGGLAHQLRNALGSARGYSRLIEKKIRADVDCADSIEKLGDELMQTEQLVSRFLDFARPLHAMHDAIDLRPFVMGIVDSFKVREDCKLICFDVRCKDSVPATGDVLLLKQAITNLVDNAAKSYQGRPGQVIVAVESDATMVAIEVSDDGEGIEPENLGKIFLPFFTTRTDGSGLGLPLAKKIVDLHKGLLTIRSSEGNGTTVRIELPTSGTLQRQYSSLSIS